MLAAALVIALVVTGAAADRVWRLLAPRATEDECALLVDRYIDQASRQRLPTADSDDIARAKAEARQGSKFVEDRDACIRDLTAEQVRCALRSTNIDDMERCLQ